MIRTKRVLLAVVVVAAGVLFAAPAAYAVSTEGPYSLENQGTVTCLDDTSSGFRMWPCNDSNPQEFIQLDWDDGTVRFQNVNTGRCIDDTNDFGLRTWGCNDGQNQSWWVIWWNDGTRSFQNQGTGLCLCNGDTGGHPRMATCSDSVAGSWYLW